MLLTDKHLPRFQFSERHAIRIRGAAAHVHEAVATVDMAGDPVVAALFWMRRLPARLLSRTPRRAAGFRLDRFTLLERDASQSVYGLAGQFWRLDPEPAPVADAAAFAAFDACGTARLVIGFRVEALSAQRTLLSTETRIHCQDHAALLPMACYWAVIRPWSGLIRRRFLRRVKHRVERRIPPAPSP